MKNCTRCELRTLENCNVLELASSSRMYEQLRYYLLETPKQNAGSRATKYDTFEMVNKPKFQFSVSEISINDVSSSS